MEQFTGDLLFGSEFIKLSLLTALWLVELRSRLSNKCNWNAGPHEN